MFINVKIAISEEKKHITFSLMPIHLLKVKRMLFIGSTHFIHLILINLNIYLKHRISIII